MVGPRLLQESASDSPLPRIFIILIILTTLQWRQGCLCSLHSDSFIFFNINRHCVFGIGDGKELEKNIRQ